MKVERSPFVTTPSASDGTCCDPLRSSDVDDCNIITRDTNDAARSCCTPVMAENMLLRKQSKDMKDAEDSQHKAPTRAYSMKYAYASVINGSSKQRRSIGRRQRGRKAKWKLRIFPHGLTDRRM